ALGAIVGRGRRRAIWLGASLFGAGYLVLAFDSVGPYPGGSLATNPLVHALWSGNPRVTSEDSDDSPNAAAANERILEALDRPFRMRSPPPTSLGDVLEAMKQATRAPGYPGISIYVDPLGLQEAERSLGSLVAIDDEGVPLSTSLASALEPIGL